MILDLVKRWRLNGLRRPAGAKQDPCRFRCGLESLEPRLAPAVIAVTTTADLVDPDDGEISLREAIDLANASPTLDTIRLPAGVYTIELPGQNEDANRLGDFDIASPVKIQGAGAKKTIIDGNQVDRVFHLLGADAEATFVGVTIRNGFVGSFEQQGGGIRSESGDVTLIKSVVRDNASSESDGGGISTESGDVTLIKSTVRDNRSLSGVGGGIDTTSGAVTLFKSIVRDNQADGGGGGIATLSGRITVVKSTVEDNTTFSGMGGGIFANLGFVDLQKSTVRDNSAINGPGGGVAVFLGDASICKSTITGNSALLGGGVFLGSGTGVVKKSTIAGNTARNAGPDVYGNFIDLGGNRIGDTDGSTGFFDDVNGNQVG